MSCILNKTTLVFLRKLYSLKVLTFWEVKTCFDNVLKSTLYYQCKYKNELDKDNLVFPASYLLLSCH